MGFWYFLSPYSMSGFILFGTGLSAAVALHMKVYLKCSWEHFFRIISNGFGITLLAAALALFARIY
ncbi:MAG: hypothetical protein ACE3JN_02850 [Ectobacillus sp.]